jgi:hypothetical protein
LSRAPSAAYSLEPFAEAAINHEGIGPVPVADEGLGAVQDVVVAVLYCARLQLALWLETGA